MGPIIWLAVWALLSFFISRKVKSTITIIGGGFIGSLIILIIFYGIKGTLIRSPEMLDACALAEAFANNEMAAIAQYDGKTLFIKGVAGSKGDSLNGLFLQIPCGKFWPAVQCFFKKSKASDLAKIPSGQVVSIKGKCKGKTLGVLIFENCSIIYN